MSLLADLEPIEAGDTPAWQVTVVGLNSGDLRTPGTTVEFVAGGGGIRIAKTTAPGGGITILDASRALIQFSAADTAALGDTRLQYVVEVTEPTGAVTTLLRGDLTIRADLD